MESDVVTIVLSSASIAAIFSAVVNGLINRRKTSAEATSLIAQAAGGLAVNLQSDNTNLRGENASLRARVEALEKASRARAEIDEAVKRALRAHAEYDLRLLKLIHDAGLDPPDYESIYDEYLEAMGERP